MRFSYPSVEAAVDEYCERFGPIVMLRRMLEPEGRGEELREALRGFFSRRADRPDDGFAYPGEYLITLGRKPA